MAWLSGWKYAKKFTIDHTTVPEDKTGYQKKITLDSSNFDFTQAKSDGADIRFTSSDKTTLIPYWIESWDSANQKAIIFVKVDTSTTTDTIFYMYFGNPNATDASDGDSVFEFFDDFNGTSLDTNKWSIIKEGDSNAIAELDEVGNLHLAGVSETISSANVLSKNTFTNGFALQIRRKYTDKYYADVSIGNGVLQDFDNGGTSSWWHTAQGDGYFFLCQTDKHIEAKTPSSAASISLSYTTTDYGELNTYEIDEFIYDSDGNLKWIFNETQILSAIDTDYLSNTKYIGLHQGEYSNGNGGDSYIDWVLARKYISSEPSYTVGATELAPITLSGTLYDKNGTAMSVACPVFAIDKDTGDLLGSTTSNTDGTFTIDVAVDSGTKVLFVTEYEGTYDGDKDIAGAWLDTVQ